MTFSSIEYWFRILDLDGDGRISLLEMETFYNQLVKYVVPIFVSFHLVKLCFPESFLFFQALRRKRGYHLYSLKLSTFVVSIHQNWCIIQNCSGWSANSESTPCPSPIWRAMYVLFYCFSSSILKRQNRYIGTCEIFLQEKNGSQWRKDYEMYNFSNLWSFSVDRHDRACVWQGLHAVRSQELEDGWWVEGSKIKQRFCEWKKIESGLIKDHSYLFMKWPKINLAPSQVASSTLSSTGASSTSRSRRRARRRALRYR